MIEHLSLITIYGHTNGYYQHREINMHHGHETLESLQLDIIDHTIAIQKQSWK